MKLVVRHVGAGDEVVDHRKTDPKDIDYLEVQRGSYSAEYGDRSYGVFNVVPRTGFERNRKGELVATFGNFYRTNDQLSFGDPTERFAWYGSVNGNRSDLGLETPVPQVLHDRGSGLGAFAKPSRAVSAITSASAMRSSISHGCEPPRRAS